MNNVGQGFCQRVRGLIVSNQKKKTGIGVHNGRPQAAVKMRLATHDPAVHECNRDGVPCVVYVWEDTANTAWPASD